MMQTGNRLRYSLFCLCFAVTAGIASAEMRNWTSRNGHTVEATLVKQDSFSVSLKTKDRKDLEISPTKLSAKDQRYLATARSVNEYTEVNTDFMVQRNKALQSLAECEVALKSHGVVSKDIAAARKTLDEMMASRAASKAWRGLASRETKTQRESRSTLERYLKMARAQLAIPRQQLALIKKAKFEAWARANPEAARLLEIQRRAEAAVSAAEDAQWQAQKARASADQAQMDAQQAEWRIRKAENRARKAQQRSRRNEDTLRRHGIMPW